MKIRSYISENKEAIKTGTIVGLTLVSAGLFCAYKFEVAQFMVVAKKLEELGYITEVTQAIQADNLAMAKNIIS